MIGGGKVYWGRKADKEIDDGGGSHGVVVIFVWSSIDENHLANFVDLYSSLGWNSLVCRADFLTAFYPEMALSLAFHLLSELVEELKTRPCPVIFLAFSGAPKACMYKVLQVIMGDCEAQIHPDDSQLVRNCLSGHIYDSGPLDFTSDLNVKFALHPTIRRMSGPSKLVSWMAKGISSGLDGLYLTRFESQRREYWQALYSSVEIGAPYLILCSENDDLAPQNVISSFTHQLQELGGEVKVVKWKNSPHTGHYTHNPIQYRAVISNFLEKAISVHLQKIRLLGERAHTHDEISELICDLQKVAVNSNQSLRRVATGPCDHFFLPSSAPYQSSNNNDTSSSQEEQRERSSFRPLQPTSINAHSVLGQFLFDSCVPKNIEGWDIRFGGSLNGQPYATSSSRKNSNLGFKKRFLRSRL
uniref:Transmembrane protein 53 n=1 Tax=Noccaea caerulescens TaxID=107243 RepID=A0A1J3IQ05_NOCCA